MNRLVGYHCSHEQFAPGDLLRYLERAEEVGFTGGMSSDHFHPWAENQGQSGFAWSWLGAALEATSLPIGVIAIPGNWRYHPAIIAQASATLASMYPGRLWIAPGSGEALNESIVGRGWPHKSERNARLREAIDIIRALWRGETVTRHDLIPTENARLYTLPAEPPLMIGTALSPETARWVGTWADGLVTSSRPRDDLRKMIDAFREGGGEDKPMFLQAQISWAPKEEDALAGAFDQWRYLAFSGSILAQLPRPADFEELARHVRPEDLRRNIRISSDLGQQAAWLAEDLEMGFHSLMLHNVNREQERFIDAFAEHVLPSLPVAEEYRRCG